MTLPRVRDVDPALGAPMPSIQRFTGEKMRRKNRTKHLKASTRNCKKRWQRLFYRAHPESPRIKTMRLLRHASTMSIKKSLLFHNVLLDEIRLEYSATKQEHTKQMYFRLLAGSMVKKYLLRSYMQTQMGFSVKRWSTFPNKINNCDVTYHRKKCVSLAVRFRQRDDNSRMTTGKRDTVTEKRNKKQKRLLSDTIQNIHAKYLAEYRSSKIRYSLFVPCAKGHALHQFEIFLDVPIFIICFLKVPIFLKFENDHIYIMRS